MNFSYILCATTALFCLPAMAAEPSKSALDDIIARGTLKIGTTGDYKPFTFLDTTTGNYEGFDIDLARDLGAALGVKVEFVQTKWGDLMKDFGDAKFDVAMGGISVTLDRQKKAFFSTPYLREGKAAIAGCKSVEKFQTLAAIDANGVKVIVNPGGTNEKFDRANLKAAEIVMNKDNLSIFDELAAGKADVMITDASETLFQQKQHPGVLCAIHPEKPFDFAEKAYLLPRDPALKDFVDQWLHIERENGAFNAIFAKWLK